ncbi:MAG: hypothetical protein COB94_005325 [Gammaproteobacteria bacterium]|nr:hypothetical protein [Gammaproteobacteria bacterium]
MNVRSKKFTLIYFIVATSAAITIWLLVDGYKKSANVQFDDWLEYGIEITLFILIFHAYIKAWEVWIKPRMTKDNKTGQ